MLPAVHIILVNEQRPLVVQIGFLTFRFIIIGRYKLPRQFSVLKCRLLPDLADYEKIRKFSIICEELNVENDTLTPTLKVKKRVLMERYKDMIEEMYQ